MFAKTMCRPSSCEPLGRFDAVLLSDGDYASFGVDGILAVVTLAGRSDLPGH
ncbi:hypothetical protein [Streptomyces yanii]|uniref:Uncharacterized protein n=1 Tax=Streptomyces yanii TaxID=78510 RepID=A0ABV5R3Z8_9ACTN